MTVISTRSTVLALAAAALGVAAPAFATPVERPANPAPAPSATPAAAARAETATRYCLRYTPTGTRIERKMCHTRQEWMQEGFDPLAN